jgi:hypothetical protein
MAAVATAATAASAATKKDPALSMPVFCNLLKTQKSKWLHNTHARSEHPWPKFDRKSPSGQTLVLLTGRLRPSRSRPRHRNLLLF